MVRSESRILATQGGYEIAARIFRPDGAVRASVLIASAMGVSQVFYAPLATWLASEGFRVATFDYFGTGESRTVSLRALTITISDWAIFDCEAMIAELLKESRSAPLYWLGHSLGGQILGLVPSRDRIAKAVTVACGSGYWLENPPRLKWRVWWLWYVAAPISMSVLGYFPGKRLRKVGDLPKGVMAQWRRWCLNPNYVIGVEGAGIRAQYAALTTPITSLSFVDDEYMSAKNIESLHGFYRNAPRTMIRIAPTDVSASRIGHFGFFNERFRDSLWQRYLLQALA